MTCRAVVVAVIALAALTACAGGSTPPLAIVSNSGPGSGLRGDLLQPATREPTISLTDTSGHRYDLRRATKNRVTLIYFGYTHCPDICPTVMADAAQALRESATSVRSKVTVVFISVDPRRDSRTVIRRWLDNFNTGFVGLRGPIRQIISAQRKMGVPVSRVAPHSKHGYTVEHSAELLAFTPDAKAHVLYLDGPTTISDLRHDLAILTTSPTYAR